MIDGLSPREKLRLQLVELYFRHTGRMDDMRADDVLENVEKLEEFILDSASPRTGRRQGQLCDTSEEEVDAVGWFAVEFATALLTFFREDPLKARQFMTLSRDGERLYVGRRSVDVFKDHQKTFKGRCEMLASMTIRLYITTLPFVLSHRAYPKIQGLVVACNVFELSHPELPEALKEIASELNSNEI